MKEVHSTLWLKQMWLRERESCTMGLMNGWWRRTDRWVHKADWREEQSALFALHLLSFLSHFLCSFSTVILWSFSAVCLSLSLPLPSPFRDCQKLAWPCLSLCISFSLVRSLTLSCCKTGARFFSPFLKGFCFYFSVFIVPIHFRKRQPILWFMPWNFLWCFFKLFFRKHNFKVITVIFIVARTATIILLYIFNPYYYCTVFPG